MKPELRLINVGRGRLVDEAALITALREKKIGGAALDVFEHEPPPADSPLWALENLLITPHTAGLTEKLGTGNTKSIAETCGATSTIVRCWRGLTNKRGTRESAGAIRLAPAFGTLTGAWQGFISLLEVRRGLAVRSTHRLR